MANKPPPITFPELDPPKGRRAILRSAEEVAAETAATLEAEESEKPAIQQSSKQKLHSAGKQESWNSRNTENKKAVNRADYPKATYRLNPEALDAVDDIKRLLRRKYNTKVTFEEIVEEAILQAYQELLKKEEESFLVSKFSGNTENKKS